MPPLAATEFPSKAVRNLANLTASSATFQGLVGAASEAAALERIYWPETIDRVLEGEVPEPPPRVILGPASAGGVRSRGPGDWLDEGALFWALELVVPAQYAQSPRDRLTWFQNQYGAILREMFTNMRAASGSTKLRMLAALPFEDGGAAELSEDDKPAEPEIWRADIWRVVYAIEY